MLKRNVLTIISIMKIKNTIGKGNKNITNIL